MANATFTPMLNIFPESSAALPAIAAVIGIISALLTFYVYPALFPPKDGIYELGGISILTAWPFFTKRYDFLWSHFKKSGEKMFRFRVLQHRVVALSGEEGRKVFFGDKHLNFTEGYRILMGGVPNLADIDIEQEESDVAGSFSKRLLHLLRKERLAEVIPTLFDDINRRMELWGKEGEINPFKDVYDLVFQMTVRMATCRELAEDKEAVTRLSQLYWNLEKSATPVALLLPWFPGAAKKAKKDSTMNLYTMLSDYVELRRKADVPSSDAIDLLIADGCDNKTIIGFTLGVVFAGVINTGINSCWDMLYLGAHPEWKQKVTAEVNSLILKYTNTTSSDPLHKRLSAIPITAWEDEMPAMDLVIRETLRLTQTGAALRRNVLEDIKIEDKVLQKGDFVTYSLADTHLNPDIFPNPLSFDPERYGEGREEDKQGTFVYLGWGAGRHPCTGMKVAKLEIKMIVALFLAGYEYELVDASGAYPKALPQPDRNDIQQARPLGDPCYIKFKRVVE